MTNTPTRPGAPGQDETAALPASFLSRTPPDRQDLSDLCHDLANLLYQPEVGADTLRRQAYLLDQILYTLMQRHAAERIESGKQLEDWLGLVLRLQKQCMDTIKSVEAIEYMKALSPPRRPHPRPTPAKSGNELKEPEEWL